MNPEKLTTGAQEQREESSVPSTRPPEKEDLSEGLLKRRADRVSMETPIAVRGQDLEGEAFGEQTKAILLSRLGAAIVLKRALAPGSQIVIRNLATGSEAPCRVVNQLGVRSDGCLYGVSLLDPGVNLWGIGFPPLAKARNTAARLLLHCEACRNAEVVYMDEMEAEVFAAHSFLSRFCSQCQRRSLWRDGLPETPFKPIAISDVRTTNERLQPRVQVRLRVCIRQPGAAEEVLFSDNVSRGGLSFKCPSHYIAGSIIQIAVPFSLSSGNVFVPARIVYARPVRTEGSIHHGATYIQAK